MALNKNDKGLTLIELLVTIAVIAIVAAISVPVITNVIADSRTSSASAMQAQAQAFIDKYEASGDWDFDPVSQTFIGGIDEDGNGIIVLGTASSPGAEVIETLVVDAGQFTATVVGTTATVNEANETVIASGISNANLGTGADNRITNIVVQPNGKILVGGGFSSFNGENLNRIVRLNPDGTRDATFSIGTGFGNIGNRNVNAITLQSDGKILVGGAFLSYQGSITNSGRYLTRLNPDGSKDTSFNIGTGPTRDCCLTTYIDAILVQTDGKILVFGSFTSFNGVSASHLVRLNTNGSVDESFQTGAGLTTYSNSASHDYVALQPNGKILVGGASNSYNGVTTGRIVRLNSDGSRDGTFDAGLGFGSSTYPIIIQPDGKILVGGFFSTFNGVSTGRIIRLNADGTRDNTFSIGTGFNNGVYSLLLQSDGRILVAGSFSSFNGTTAPRIVRLNSDGTRDTSFNPGTAFPTSSPFDVILQRHSWGNILVGGTFTSFDDKSVGRIAVIGPDGSDF